MTFTENRIDLDFFGMFCAPSVNEKHPETFFITAHIKEPVNPTVLQQASDDLFHRLPFLSGRLSRDKRGFYYEPIREVPQIIPENEPAGFSMYYKQGKGHLLRVLYAEKYIKVETAHFVIDGRGLSKIVNTLLVRYFELLGINADKSGVINCDDGFNPEEMEDALVRFSGTYTPRKDKEKLPKSVYKSGYKRSGDTWTLSRDFSLEKINVKAKSYGLSVTGYLLLEILSVLQEERDFAGNKKPITATLPVDCRRFFPTETLRNFSYSKNIVLPESAKREQMAQQIKTQFAKIDIAYIQTAVDELKMALDMFNKMPFRLRNFIIKQSKGLQFKKITFVFSSLGLIKLPKEIEARIDSFEFLCSPEEYHPYTFSCISLSNTLTLSVSSVTSDKSMVEKLFEEIASN